MRLTAIQLLVGTLVLFLTASADAVVTVYTDEAQYLSDLAAMGYVPMHEGFEDDAAWGLVRTTIVGGQITAPGVTNLGITWTANNVNGGVTTGSGPARTGNWGFFCLPHGDFANGIGDGWVGASSRTLYGVCAWLETNTVPAEASLVLDGHTANPVLVDFGETCVGQGEDEVCTNNAKLSYQHKFLGVIKTDGFTRFEFGETEGTLGDQKFMFADDFTFGIIHAPTVLTLSILNEAKGTVAVDPNLPSYDDPNTTVTLTATPVEGEVFKHWKIYDPNHPGDANYIVLDANNPITILMDADREVIAVFKCGSGMALLLPMMLGVLGLFVLVRRRR